MTLCKLTVVFSALIIFYVMRGLGWGRIESTILAEASKLEPDPKNVDAIFESKENNIGIHTDIDIKSSLMDSNCAHIGLFEPSYEMWQAGTMLMRLRLALPITRADSKANQDTLENLSALISDVQSLENKLYKSNSSISTMVDCLQLNPRNEMLMKSHIHCSAAQPLAEDIFHHAMHSISILGSEIHGVESATLEIGISLTKFRPLEQNFHSPHCSPSRNVPCRSLLEFTRIAEDYFAALNHIRLAKLRLQKCSHDFRQAARFLDIKGFTHHPASVKIQKINPVLTSIGLSTCTLILVLTFKPFTNRAIYRLIGKREWFSQTLSATLVDISGFWNRLKKSFAGLTANLRASGMRESDVDMLDP